MRISIHHVISLFYNLIHRARSLELLAGSVNIYDIDYYTAQFRNITNSSDIRNHDKFDPDELSNDISLIRVEKPLVLNLYVWPIRLSFRMDEWEDFEGRPAIISGWGKLRSSKKNSSRITSRLRFASVEIGSFAACEKYHGEIPYGAICTRRAGLCHGDSGSPLVLDDRLFGVSSYGPKGDCEQYGPDVFSRVSYYLDWIRKITGLYV